MNRSLYFHFAFIALSQFIFGPQAIAEAALSSPEKVQNPHEIESFAELPRESVIMLAAPREVQTKVTFLRNENGSFFEPQLGGDLGIIRKSRGRFRSADRNSFDLSVRGVFIPRFQFASNSFDLWNTDFIGGMAGIYRFGLSALDVFLYHKSSHLGPRLAQIRADENHSFETIRVLYTRQCPAGLEIYSGLSFTFHADPARIANNADLHLGANWRSPYLGERLYFSADLEARQYYRGINVALETGYELGSKIAGGRRQRVFLNYYGGHSPMGQFHRSTESSLSMGIAAAY